MSTLKDRLLCALHSEAYQEDFDRKKSIAPDDIAASVLINEELPDSMFFFNTQKSETKTS